MGIFRAVVVAVAFVDILAVSVGVLFEAAFAGARVATDHVDAVLVRIAVGRTGGAFVDIGAASGISCPARSATA